MNSYEIAMIDNPNQSDKDVQKLAQEVKDLLIANGATAISDERVERRALAYPVQKHAEGIYVYINFTGPAVAPEKVRFELRHREGLMRIAFIAKPIPVIEPAPVREVAPEPQPQPEAPPEPQPEVAGG